MAAHPFVIVPSLAAIAVAYAQADLIADRVMPRVPVDTETFRYAVYNKGDAFVTPDTAVSRKGAPNQIDWSSSEASATVQDHGLDTPIPNVDLAAWRTARAAGGAALVSTVDPQARKTKLLTGALLNRREKRVADMTFDLANYGAANKLTLSGTSQWSDFTNSDPIAAIEDALDAMIVRPQYSAMGMRVWTRLKRHPKVISRLYGSASTRGSARMADFCEEIGIREIFVGQAFLNTAAEGQAANLQRAWGDHASFFYRGEDQDITGGTIQFGLTAQWGDRVAGVIEDADVGLRGGIRVRAGESVKELITANDMGFLFRNAVA